MSPYYEKKAFAFCSNITNSIWFKMLIYGSPNTTWENQQPTRVHPQFLLTSFCSSLDSVVQFLIYSKLQHIIILLPWAMIQPCHHLWDLISQAMIQFITLLKLIVSATIIHTLGSVCELPFPKQRNLYLESSFGRAVTNKVKFCYEFE